MTFFFEQLARFENNIACIEGDTQLTYAQLQLRVEHKKAQLREMMQRPSSSNSKVYLTQTPVGRTPDNTQALINKAISPCLPISAVASDKCLVAIVADNSIATLVNYLAVLQLKHAIIFVTQAEYDGSLASNSASITLSFSPDLFLSNEQISMVNTQNVTEQIGQESSEQSGQDIAEQSGQVSAVIHQDVALLLSTSGSTGESKQVVLSYANLAANCTSICAYLPILASDVTITTLPFHYSYGLSLINTHLASGAAIVFTQLSAMQRGFWDCFENHKVTSFAGVPHSYDMLLRLKFTQKTLPHLRYFTQAGGKLAASKVTLLAEYAKQHDIAFYVMYGQTEATARMSFVEPNILLQKPRSIGKAIPNTELLLIDDQGHEIAQAQQPGQLLFKGDNIMLGYATERADLAFFNVISRLETGDVGYRDSDGDFFITGRTKRIVKLFGERISLDQVEELVHKALFELSSANTLFSSAVIGNDKTLIIMIELNTEKSINTDTHLASLSLNLKKLLQATTGIHPSALRIESLEKLPLLSNGKTDYQSLTARFMGVSLEDYQQQFDQLMQAESFALDKTQKQQLLTPVLNSLHQLHLRNCPEYQRICAHAGYRFDALDDFPFIAVRLFKQLTLRSIADTDVFRVLNSSGTTGQSPARIFLDKATSARQSKTLVNVMQSFIGKQRLPMLVIDSESVAKGTSGFSARTAGIQGMAFFGRKPVYALQDDMQPDWPLIDAFFEQHKTGPVLIFGFTFMVWQHFVQALKQTGRSYNTDNVTLIHSGGWKKLESEKVDNATFKEACRQHLPNIKVHNFYGMAEQVGSVFVECSSGYLHAPNMADIIIRNPYDLSVQPLNEEGLIQVLSAIPTSYPGYSILTEDRGRILGEDDCACGRRGKYFEVLGRLPKVEVRGCSDTHEPD